MAATATATSTAAGTVPGSCIEPADYPVTAGFPVVYGNSVENHIDGKVAFEAIQAGIRSASSAVYAAISFMDRDVAFADGTLLWEEFDAAVDRGVRVCVLLWNPAEGAPFGNVVSASSENVEWLAGRNTRAEVRWDTSPNKPHCHHQKFWVFDADTDTNASAIVGGIVMKNYYTQQDSTHNNVHLVHDLNVGVRGPVVSQVAAHFRMRWNNCGECSFGEGQDLPEEYEGDVGGKLEGGVAMQLGLSYMTRMYTSSQTLPHDPFTYGERSIYAHVLNALKGAKHAVYIENQHIADTGIVSAMMDAMDRGVTIAYGVPAIPMRAVSMSREEYMAEVAKGTRNDRYHSLWGMLEHLTDYDNFTLFGLAVPAKGAGFRPIYIHSKLTIVDDEWFSVGSANHVDISYQYDHTEMNVAVWDREAATALRCELMSEHLGFDVSGNSLSEAMEYLKEAVAYNSAAMRAGDQQLRGRVFPIDGAVYGTVTRNVNICQLLPKEEAGAAAAAGYVGDMCSAL